MKSNCKQMFSSDSQQVTPDVGPETYFADVRETPARESGKCK